MQRRLLFIVILILFVFVSVYGVLVYLRSFGTVQIEFADSVSGVSALIYKSPDGSIEPEKIIEQNQVVEKSIDSGKSIKLKNGMYLLAAEGDGYSKQLQAFTLKNDTVTVVVEPSFSEKRLEQIRIQEESTVRDVVRKEFSLGNKYRFGLGEVYRNGNWYGITIIPNLTDEQIRTRYVDIWRVLLHKESGQWKVVGKPSLLLSAPDHPDIPKDVLISLNKLRPTASQEQ